MGNNSPGFPLQFPEEIDDDARNRHQNPEEEDLEETHIFTYEVNNI
jgi:hypothetical protein